MVVNAGSLLAEIADGVRGRAFMFPVGSGQSECRPLACGTYTSDAFPLACV